MLRVPDESFPHLATLTQEFPATAPLDLRAALDRAWQLPIRPGSRIAVAVGSRGVARLDEVVRAVLHRLIAGGAEPFIVPAMGSHGGATAEGQRDLLAGYGVSEAAMGVPVKAGMQATLVGRTDDGVPVHMATEALAADGILVVNRVKPHSEFRGPVESGILKMIAVGLGKEDGASAFHVACQRLGFPRVVETVARVKFAAATFLGGVALIENQRHQLARLEVLAGDQIEAREPALLDEARSLMPKLPFDDIDLLIVDAMGKNISGAGIDPNVIGRDCFGYFSALTQIPTRRPFVRRIFVRDLTPESHGNAIGIGVADFTTTRLVRSIDLPTMYMNVLTSQVILSGKIPLHFDSDREVLGYAFGTLALDDVRRARVVRIRDSLSLDRMDISEALVAEASAHDSVTVTGPPVPFRFDVDGNLPPLAAG